MGGVDVRDQVSLYTPGCPGTQSVDQASLQLRNLPASDSQVLRLKACTTTAQSFSVLEETFFSSPVIYFLVSLRDLFISPSYGWN